MKTQLSMLNVTLPARLALRFLTVWRWSSMAQHPAGNRLGLAGMWALLLMPWCLGQEPTIDWKMQTEESSVSLRGISFPSDKTFWASGSKGSAFRLRPETGKMESQTLDQWPKLEFRSVHAINEQVACMASAGTPAIVLRTTDGGVSWKEVYRHESPQAFIDGFTFWDSQNGMAVSDPVDGNWLLLQTSDAGMTWQERDPSHRLAAVPGEAAFAASSGSLFALDAAHFWLGTGGETKQPYAACYRWSEEDRKSVV